MRITTDRKITLLIHPFARTAAFLVAILILLNCSCSGQQTEEQALESLRQMTKDGKLPPESAVAAIESRFAGKRTGALAKLLRARVRLEANNDPAGAAEILDSDVFAKQTKLADYAHWLRGRALRTEGKHGEAMTELAKVWTQSPDSLRALDAKVLWAESAIASGAADKVVAELSDLISKRNPRALFAAASASEAAGDQGAAISYYRKTYFFGAGTDEARQAEAKLNARSQPLTPQNADEILSRARGLYAARNWPEAEKAFTELATRFPAALSVTVQLERIDTYSNLKRMADAQSVFNSIPASAPEKEKAYYDLVIDYARLRQWPDARRTAEEMRQKFAEGGLTPKAWVDAGLAARDAKNKTEEQYFLGAALISYPTAVEVASAQFELAWMAHEARDFSRSSQLLIEHLARYADKDTTNRGRAGYWAARDSERAGRIGDACLLYDAVIYRYSANWYGYIALDRREALKKQGKCSGIGTDGTSELTAQAAAHLKTVTVAPETSGPAEIARAEKSDDLTTIGLFDWAMDELKEAKKTAQESPRINLALARHYRMKGDNVNALLALAKSYPDYSQMFPEEMGREEWDIFYPLISWSDIKYWAAQRRLDAYQVAGLIRQESVFNPRARSGANAFGLMQLIVPTANTMAKKYVAKISQVTPTDLYNPPLNIELGTAYMRDQLDKFGRIEYMAVAYNAGPGRVPQWRAALPAEIDEFVEEIPFRETKGYVQGVIRNSAQYRRLYDESGKFRPNVGSKPLRGAIDSLPAEQFAAENPEIIISRSSAEE